MPRCRYLRPLLAARYEWMEGEIYARAESNGYGHIPPAMARMFGHLGQHPVSLSCLARRLGVSRQAVHKMVNEARQLGLLTLIDSDEDRRTKLVTYTPDGWAMVASAERELEAIEDGIRAQLGDRDFDELLRLLSCNWSGGMRSAANKHNTHEPASTGNTTTAG